MTWNWQHPDWPDFRWDEDRLSRAETLFSEGAGVMIGSSRHLHESDRENLIVEVMSLEALDTSAIQAP